MIVATTAWTPAKANLLRAIAAANASNQIFAVVPFDAATVADMALEGWIDMTIRGPVVTPQGERKLRATTKETQHGT